jgi:NAD(P)-dependent dehydrogenase (short-subunit alcohol dehydrogenase family)
MSALKIENLFGVKGYVALVTGGSSGLGFMISKVRRFAFRDINKL